MSVTLRCETCDEEYIVHMEDPAATLRAQQFALAHFEHEYCIVGMEELYAVARAFNDEMRRINEDLAPFYDSLVEALNALPDNATEGE